MNLDIYLESLFGKKVPGGKIVEVGRKTYRKCIGITQASLGYNQASVQCHTRRLSFLRANFFACHKSRRPEKCREIVTREIDRIEDLLRMHKDRLMALRNEN